MIGYIGVGGDIDGKMNPTLRALKGERVKVTLVNGELMAHDFVIDELEVKSDNVLEEGDTTSVIFIANESGEYYCSIPGHRPTMSGRFEVVERMSGSDFVYDVGVSPRKNGRPLNLGFERGNLQDWKATGNAFTPKSVTYNAAPWYPDSVLLGQAGDYYVTSGGITNYQATGTLTSEAFEITHPFASFKVSGGALAGVRVELVLVENNEVFFKISGHVNDGQFTGSRQVAFRPVVVDLKAHEGKQMFVRIVDEETGQVPDIAYIGDNIWAHISFDDFRFHDVRPTYPNEFKPDDVVILPPLDPVENSGLSGPEAVKAMVVPDGFSVTLAASEPDIVRPIAFAMDDRGRLWVVEAHTYPVRAEEGKGTDRILIFEDTDGNGTLDSRKVFIEGLNMVSGIELGFGGVWVGAAPYLMFIPIDASGDKPAGEPKILLDGWAYEDTHETLNSFKWGPDGWLYGTHGVFTHSNVGKPGASDAERHPINAGVWRYHPTKHIFEVFAHGTSNPWGIDFNDVGQPFITVCVIPHLFHVIQGARYHRQGGEHFNPYTYDDIKTIADHVHWLGDRGPHAGNFRSGAAGGGHAHAGAVFYLGNKHWGLDRDAILMNNINGYRVNVDHLKRSGSGYTASHGKDFINTNDFWSQWINFQIDPSGSMFVIDWYDKNQCHSPNPDVHDKTLGRIFKITHKQDKWVQTDLSKKSSLELVDLQLHENDWYVRHARRLLQERGADKQVHDALWKIFNDKSEVPRKLRALWALHVTDGLPENRLLELLGHPDEYVRAWVIQLLTERKAVSTEAQRKFESMAKNDQSAFVRLHLAAASQRMALNQRWTLLANLANWVEDMEDHNIPLMVWYGFEPLVEVDANRALDIAKKSKFPHLLEFANRRITDANAHAHH
ncbi:PVC-type heme-binding CxxCH protein [Parapedobacter deserti]|uniref:PVC-type heme-binding CxxCH protein n=1 Tax=Parapedobacter deserti TaxID=1912957 RepID=A0ABV7JLF0_9SPHI